MSANVVGVYIQRLRRKVDDGLECKLIHTATDSASASAANSPAPAAAISSSPLTHGTVVAITR